MTRREVFVNWCRLALLKWRIVRGSALPSLAMALLARLDGWAQTLQSRGRQ
jgi:hypothetical protein